MQGGTLALTGAVAGNLAVWSGARFAGNGVIGGSLALLTGSTYQAAVGANGANLIRVIHFARTHEQFFADAEVAGLLEASWRSR